MICQGADLLLALAEGRQPELKMVFNRAGAILFPVSGQHRDQKATGISYEDDSRGSALAAMLRLGVIEVRHHRDFSNALVWELLNQLASSPELSLFRGWRMTYGGNVLHEQF